MVLATGCATSRVARKPLTQEEVIQLAKAQTPDSEIVQRIKASGTVYRLSAVEILRLHDCGVSSNVIDFMLQDYVEAVRWQERERWGPAWYYYGPYCYWHWPHRHCW